MTDFSLGGPAMRWDPGDIKFESEPLAVQISTLQDVLKDVMLQLVEGSPAERARLLLVRQHVCRRILFRIENNGDRPSALYQLALALRLLVKGNTDSGSQRDEALGIVARLAHEGAHDTGSVFYAEVLNLHGHIINDLFLNTHDPGLALEAIGIWKVALRQCEDARICVMMRDNIGNAYNDLFVDSRNLDYLKESAEHWRRASLTIDQLKDSDADFLAPGILSNLGSALTTLAIRTHDSGLLDEGVEALERGLRWEGQLTGQIHTRLARAHRARELFKKPAHGQLDPTRTKVLDHAKASIDTTPSSSVISATRAVIAAKTSLEYFRDTGDRTELRRAGEIVDTIDNDGPIDSGAQAPSLYIQGETGEFTYHFTLGEVLFELARTTEHTDRNSLSRSVTHFRRASAIARDAGERLQSALSLASALALTADTLQDGHYFVSALEVLQQVTHDVDDAEERADYRAAIAFVKARSALQDGTADALRAARAESEAALHSLEAANYPGESLTVLRTLAQLGQVLAREYEQGEDWAAEPAWDMLWQVGSSDKTDATTKWVIAEATFRLSLRAYLNSLTDAGFEKSGGALPNEEEKALERLNRWRQRLAWGAGGMTFQLGNAFEANTDSRDRNEWLAGAQRRTIYAGMSAGFLASPAVAAEVLEHSRSMTLKSLAHSLFSRQDSVDTQDDASLRGAELRGSSDYRISQKMRTLRTEIGRALVQPLRFGAIAARSSEVPTVYLCETSIGGGAFVVTSNNCDSVQLPMLTTDEVSRWRRSLAVLAPYFYDDTSAAAWLDDCLDWLGTVLLPLAPLVEDFGRVRMVPSGLLAGLPISCARLPGCGSLSELTTISVAPSLRFVPIRESTTPSSVLAIANQDRGKAIGELPSANEEASRVAACYAQPRVIVGEKATKDVLLQGVEDVDVIHLACHAVSDPEDVLESYLQLVDGRIGAADLLGRDWKPSTVVLSACSAGATTLRLVDESLGLATILLSAGVGNVVASLWPIADWSAPRFMESLHRGIAGGLAVASALAQAQRESSLEPIHWAGYVCLGA